jgi:putative ABC transport system ATP-binding protein
MIEARELSKVYTIDDRPVSVVDNVSLTIASGEFVAVVGSSGSGKSTLLSLLSGLDNPTSGRVVLDGEDITHKSEDELAPLRNRTLGFVFQSSHLVPSLSALENVIFPAELAGNRHARKAGWNVMERVGLTGRATNFPRK